MDSDDNWTDHEISHSLGGSANNWTGGWDGNPSSSSGGFIGENLKFVYGYGIL